MRGGKKMEWLKKLGAAIDYIENNLDKEISYDEATRIACCSPYYFQRIFLCFGRVIIRIHTPPKNDTGSI